jgi:uncharacterized protein
MKIILMVISSLLALSTSVHSASFDCNKASNFAERQVCADEALSSLDVELSSLYKKVRQTIGVLRESQLQWLKERNNCKTKQCLLASYQSRVLFFEKLLNEKTVQITRGSAYQLCQDYAGLMSRVAMNTKSCNVKLSFDNEAYKAGFADINWQEVKNPNVKDILLGYWLLKKEVSLDDFTKDPALQRKFTEYSSAYKLFWQTQMDINFDGKKEQVYKVSIGEECSGHRFFYLIHPTVVKHHMGLVGDLFMYQGRPYLQSGKQYSSLEELSGGGSAILRLPVCEMNIELGE